MTEAQNQQQQQKVDIEKAFKLMEAKLKEKFGDTVLERYNALTEIDKITFLLGFCTGTVFGRIEGVSEIAENLKA